MDGTFAFDYGADCNINKPALTLIELLIGTAIAMFVVVMTVVLYIMLQASWQETTAILEIERTANLAMEKMFRGFKAPSDAAPRGLLDARTFSIVGGTRINFDSGMDSKQRSFYLAGDKLVYDPDTSVGSDEVDIAGNISGLAFAASTDNPARVVLINLSASRPVKGVDRTINVFSEVFLRNG
jgi:type II secretory pathway pseudopilin PulG